jgi:hypothetical protein
MYLSTDQKEGPSRLVAGLFPLIYFHLYIIIWPRSCGEIDPSLLWYFMEELRLSIDETKVVRHPISLSSPVHFTLKISCSCNFFLLLIHYFSSCWFYLEDDVTRKEWVRHPNALIEEWCLV